MQPTRHSVAADLSLQVSPESWFVKIQDQGVEMTPGEFTQFAENDRKTKTRHIAFGGRFYKGLYILAEDIYKLIDMKRDTTFNRLPHSRQRTTIIHAIGKIIAGQRRKTARAEMGNFAIINTSPYDESNEFYTMDQDALIELLFNRYGTSETQVLKITTDDKVRVAGLVITKPSLREYLSDLTGKSRGGDRQALDASRSRRLMGLNLLHTNFIDPEAIVSLPEKWLSDNTQETIDSFLGEGTYNNHGRFDPNCVERINFPWTVKDVTAIFSKVDKEYHAAMDKYTKGTGGGPGADENFAAWEQRDECCVVNYSNQPSNIYLSVVHMWDKDCGFPFVSVKDPLPLDCSIDDRLNFDVGFDDDVEDSQAINCQSYASASASVIASTPSLSVTSSRREQGITKALKDLSQARSESTKMSRDLFDLMTNQVTAVRAVNQVAPAVQPHELLGHIIKTRQLMSEYKGEVILLREKKHAIKLGELDTNAKKKKIAVIAREIVDNKKMIAALNQTIEHQRETLKSITKKGNADDDEEDDNSVISSESGMTSDSGDE